MTLLLINSLYTQITCYFLHYYFCLFNSLFLNIKSSRAGRETKKIATMELKMISTHTIDKKWREQVSNEREIICGPDGKSKREKRRSQKQGCVWTRPEPRQIKTEEDFAQFFLYDFFSKLNLRVLLKIEKVWVFYRYISKYWLHEKQIKYVLKELRWADAKKPTHFFFEMIRYKISSNLFCQIIFWYVFEKKISFGWWFSQFGAIHNKRTGSRVDVFYSICICFFFWWLIQSTIGWCLQWNFCFLFLSYK
jgi:hypothetical protein